MGGAAGDNPHGVAHIYQRGRYLLAGFASAGPNGREFVVDNQYTHGVNFISSGGDCHIWEYVHLVSPNVIKEWSTFKFCN